MIRSDTDLDPLERVVEEFTSRCRGGEFPSVSEYVARHPQHAAKIEELFPVVVAMEQLRADERSKRAALARRTAHANPPQHLGDFRIVREIGRGGMGIVYEAEQRSLARPVAVKVLPRHALLLDKHLQRFQREARTAARLRHTNIVPVFGVGEQEGLHYYVMPLIRGVGLDEVIRELRTQRDASRGDATSDGSSGPSIFDVRSVVRALTAEKFANERAPRQSGEDDSGRRRAASEFCGEWSSHWRVVACIGVQAAEALDYAHAQGTLHRDIKPGNLLLDEDGVVCVADFGLARAMDDTDLSRSGDFVGTARYMAPEQARGTADARSDIYALGLTLYELLVLQPAFDDCRPGASPHAGQSLAKPVQPGKIQPGVPRDLETIVLKCLAHEPANRYQSAAALAADLRRFLEDRPILARRASAVECAGRWCRRNPALAAVSALALLLLIALAVTALAGHLRTRDAYAQTRRALEQSEATSHLALEVLDRIYAQLSPERMWIASDADPAAQACACIGLRAGDRSASSVERTAMQARASRETALLLENLLAFYDRLAAQGGEDRCVTIQSAVASRRVGDIRLCLGQLDRAEQEYLRAVDRLAVLRARAGADIEIDTELARSLNEIGNIQSARHEAGQACESHQVALSVLRSRAPGELPTAEYRYELARTFYFLAGKCVAARGDSRSHAADVRAPRLASPRIRSSEYRKSAIDLLEGLMVENPRAPDYRLLLALCCRGPGAAADPAGSPRTAQGRQRALAILEALTAEYPDVADYRYELIATYAWIPVSLFPWQGHSPVSREGELSLRKALEESKRLVDRHPSVPHYGRCHALVLAKLGAACWRNRRLAEAEALFQKAVQGQSALLARFPGLPPHDQVLFEFFRLRLAQVCLDRCGAARNPRELGTCRGLLEQCIESLVRLAGKPELAGDQLMRSSLPLAYDALSEVLTALGERHKAHEAKTQCMSWGFPPPGAVRVQ
jgi:serine/threonine protein kinase